MPVPIVGGLLGLDPLNRMFDQYVNRQCPNDVPDPGTMISAFRKGVIDEDQLRRGLKSLGFGGEAIDAMLSASKPELTPADIIRANTRGVIGAEDTRNGLKKLGYTDEDIDAMLEGAKAPIGPEEALKLYRNGKISESEYRDLLRKNGMTDDRVDSWQDINQYMPGPQDLVRFAVREALSPEAAERLGLYKDIPEEFLKEARKLGLSEDDAKKYWASHWELPGPSQVIDMFQRGILGDPDSPEAKQLLSDYLKVADYSPFWRDKIEALSWNPYTRVDGSRMYLNDAITEEELYENYRKLGYDDEHARNLVDFFKSQKEAAAAKEAAKKAKAAASTTKASGTGSGGKVAAAKNKDLSLSLIQTAYYYHELTEEEARTLIQQLDYDRWEAELITDLWDAKLVEKDQNDLIAVLKTEFQEGWLSEAEFQSELGKMNLRAAAIDIILRKEKDKRDASVKHPTKAEINRWLKKGLISEEDYIWWLGSLNYPQEVILLYLAEIRGAGA